MAPPKKPVWNKLTEMMVKGLQCRARKIFFNPGPDIWEAPKQPWSGKGWQDGVSLQTTEQRMKDFNNFSVINTSFA